MTGSIQQLSADAFPPHLREIPQSPKRLFVRGTLPSFDMKWLAVVGSRACTPYGKSALEYLIAGLRDYPIAIISGLAYGVDALAHKGALDAQLPTVAVPGSGLDWSVLYPRAHVSLAQDILASGGALVSEYDPLTKAAPYTFPQRNRIMAGICHATLIIEAREKSGSLITARLAADYNRELLVVPGSIFSAESRGTHQFLKLGATPVTEPADILKALGLEDTATRAAMPIDDLSPEELCILSALDSPRARDDLIEILALPAAETNAILSIMEIKGLIVEQYGTLRRA